MAELDVGSDYIILNFPLTTAYADITTTRPWLSALMRGKTPGNNIIVRKSSTDTPEFDSQGDGIKFAAKKYPASGVSVVICQAKCEVGSDTLQVILTLA